MSVQAGAWNLDNQPVDQRTLEEFARFANQYGPDGGDLRFAGPVGMLFRGFHTTSESHSEKQPFRTSSGEQLLTWDGRLDNRSSLIKDIYPPNLSGATDCELVSAAWRQWGTNCLKALLGNWALCLWDHREQALVLARDFVGTRPLFYEIRSNSVVWCTHLEPIVLLEGRRFELEDTYVAGYLASFPCAHLTPYKGIYSVPPGSFVRIRNGQCSLQTYWNFEPNKKIRYRTDAEYEDHFRHVFTQAVKRSLRSDSAVLAELSGGMDSSSIVCIADALVSKGEAEAPRLDTVSYYDDEEPNWDERPYFTTVERLRGRTGNHINLNGTMTFAPLDHSRFSAKPGPGRVDAEFEKERMAHMRANGNRILLSGVGGDEFLGGVPTPIPELADLIVQGRPIELIRKLTAWSFGRKEPWLHLLFETIGKLTPVDWFERLAATKHIPSWLEPAFVRRHQEAFLRGDGRMAISGALPSQQAVGHALERLRRQIASSFPPLVGCYEVRYPYLDRDLCEFVHSIPREQLLRPGQRRSLMKRALAGILPNEIINRRRKAYVVRGPLATLEREWPYFRNLLLDSLAARGGFVVGELCTAAYRSAMHGRFEHFQSLVRTLKLECWLNQMVDRDLLEGILHGRFLPSGNGFANERSPMQSLGIHSS